MLLVVALLVLGVALVAGMGLMTSQIASYRGVSAVEGAAQALALAQAGLEDARLKMERDYQFPPRGDGNFMEDTSPNAQGQTLFTYCEDVRVGGKRFGSYQVSIDTSFVTEYKFTRIISNGIIGPLEAPIAQRTLKVDIDTNVGDASRNSSRYLPIKIEDMSGL